MIEWLIIATIVGIIAALIVGATPKHSFQERARACEARGGVMVHTVPSGTACVART